MHRFRITIAGVIWLLYIVGALLLLDMMDLATWAIVITASAGALALILSAGGLPWHPSIDRRDLIAVALLYLLVLVSFRAAFVMFTADNVLGLFLTFAFGLMIGVVGPIVYQVWIRKRDMTSLGLGRQHLPEAVVLGLVLGLAQFSVTIWGYQLPEPVEWVPLLVMSLVVGFFEAMFFRGFIQTRLEASLGTGPGVAGAALLYSIYHIGYGMGLDEMWFLLGLGVVYAIAFRLVENILVLWPLLTPIGAFFNNVQAGDIDLPWASIAGFANIGMLMAIAIWLAYRHLRKRASLTQALLAGSETSLEADNP